MINKKKCNHEIEISESYSKKLKNISMVMLRVINKESNIYHNYYFHIYPASNSWISMTIIMTIIIYLCIDACIMINMTILCQKLELQKN